MRRGRELDPAAVAAVTTLPELAGALRELRRRQARRRGDSPLTYRELAARTGWGHAVIGDYFIGKSLPSVERFDVLVQLLDATVAEQGALATARDRVEEDRRRPSRAKDGAPAGPRQLPGAVAGFVGRADHLARLDQLLAAGPLSSIVPVVALCGPAGVGKTALAVRWAHQVADRFPDGQLYVDLRGYDPGEPLATHAALAGLLRALGVDPVDVPVDVDECAARYRTTVAERRVLVLLDNAGSADQVRPLIPGAASCFVVVTSRNDLSGLVAREGARRIAVDLLPLPEAVTLLRTLIGARVDADPAAAVELAQHCARLPLALRLAAEVAVGRAGRGLAELLDEHRGEERRLDLLTPSTDPGSAVRAVLSWSYRHLAAGDAEALDLLGLRPGHDVDAYAIAALAGIADVAGANRLLRRLIGVHLVREDQPGRYGMHDLLRAYAAERARSGIDPERRQAAITRLLDHYLCTAAAAMDSVFPQEHDRRPPAPVSGYPMPAVADVADALDWLDREQPTLVAVVGYAARNGWPAHAVRLSRTLWRYFDTTGRHHDALAVHSHALAAARGDDPAEADIHSSLGIALYRLGRYPEATEQYRSSIAAFRLLGDGDGEARSLSNLAGVHERLSQHSETAACLEQALALSRASGDRQGEGGMLANLGVAYRHLGRYEEALESTAGALSIGRHHGNRHMVCYASSAAALVLERLGRHAEAVERLWHAITIEREIGDRTGEAEDLIFLGRVYLLLRRYPEAIAILEQASALSREIGYRRVEAGARNGLGEVSQALGRPGEAAARHREALDLARRHGDRHEEARAFEGIAAALIGTDRSAEAVEHWHDALAIYAELGAPEAEEVRARLDSA